MTGDETPHADGFDAVPSHADAPRTCQFGSCTSPPRFWIHFSMDPDEFLCYCDDHVADLRAEPDATSSGLIR